MQRTLKKKFRLLLKRQPQSPCNSKCKVELCSEAHTIDTDQNKEGPEDGRTATTINEINMSTTQQRNRSFSSSIGTTDSDNVSTKSDLPVGDYLESESAADAATTAAALEGMLWTLDLGDLMESELACGICSEIFVEATSLCCSHTFCRTCIEQWRRHSRTDCPVCRSKITSQVAVRVLDSFIDGLVKNFDEESQKRRSDLIAERARESASEQEAFTERNNRANRSSSTPRERHSSATQCYRRSSSTQHETPEERDNRVNSLAESRWDAQVRRQNQRLWHNRLASVSIRSTSNIYDEPYPSYPHIEQSYSTDSELFNTQNMSISIWERRRKRRRIANEARSGLRNRPQSSSAHGPNELPSSNNSNSVDFVGSSNNDRRSFLQEEIKAIVVRKIAIVLVFALLMLIYSSVLYVTSVNLF